MVGEFLGQSEDRYARITGYAGTGKTTLIRELNDSYPGIQVLCPTGKAALRVREATGLFASTIHRFLYDPREDPQNGRVRFEVKKEWDSCLTAMEGKLVLIDEASMIDKQVWADLVLVAGRVGFHLLVMGDLFQLPPVSKGDNEGFSTLKLPMKFSVNLTEVHRQALGSPIIRASMMLRSGAPEYEAMETLEPLGQHDLIAEMVAARARGGEAICFTNARRHSLNARMREALGLPPDMLQAGEPILVTQNSYQLNCWNGEVLDFEGWQTEPSDRTERSVVDRFTKAAMMMRFGIGRVADQDAVMSPEQFTGQSELKHLNVNAIRRAARSWYCDLKHEDIPVPYLDCNYGYALTCHKAQGSEWPEVIVVIEDKLTALRGIEKKRWLYTAITRAKESVRYCYVED